MDHKIWVVDKRLDRFEVRVLEQPAPTIDMSSIQNKLATLLANVDSILNTPAIDQ